MNVIIDVNLWISFLIGKKMSAMRVLFTNPRITAYVCKELCDEFYDVSTRLKIRKYITENDVQETFRLMDKFCRYVSIGKMTDTDFSEKKDLYLLSLVETVKADFLLTGDKHLLSQKSHNQTKIVTYKEVTEIIGI